MKRRESPEGGENMPDKRITTFIGKHHVMTLATSAQGVIHCSNLFYAYDKGHFVVTTSIETLHGEQAMENAEVAASIVLETSVVGKLQGIQLRAKMFRPEGQMLEQARRAYLKRFPFAIMADLELWVIKPYYMKFTDNRLGFGKKLFWEG